MKLAIISHTEHYRNEHGEIVGWGPTVTEINHLVDRFEKIYHVAFFYEKEAPQSSVPYTSNLIEFVALPPSGGRSVFGKLSVIKEMAKTIKTVSRILEKVDVFQFRAPVGIGIYLIPYFTYKVKKQGWFKYAGNWAQENAPLGYALQRKMLKNQARKVTINGKWPEQPKHCLTFENPCLTLAERAEGKNVLENKTYQPKFTFCFVGRLEDEKGVQRILNALGKIKNIKDYVDHIHLIGNGKKRASYEEQVLQKDLPVKIHGFLNREEVFNYYKLSHFVLLPSDSEGFPKVIAEAMNYGCIPIVSAVSSIPQYVTPEVGYLLGNTIEEDLISCLEEISEVSTEELIKKSKNSYQVAEKFTFENYNQRIIEEILA